MRVAVISDIHANCFALNAALGDLGQYSVDRIVCLGDVVQGGAQPRQTVKCLRELACPVVMGNADAWLLGEENDTVEPATQQQREVRTWTLTELSSADLDYVRDFRRILEVTLDHEQRLLCFHGSPNSFDDVLLPETSKDDWDRLLGPFSPAIMAGGHTHTQQVRRVRDGLFFNPGSIGVAYNYYLAKEQFHTDAWAEYAILSYGDGPMSLSFHRVPYNLERLIGIIQSSGRPHANSMVSDYRR